MLANTTARGFTRVAKRIVEEITAIQPRERVLILSDTAANPALVEALCVAAEWVGGDVMNVIVPWRRPLPHGYFNWGEPPKRLWNLIQESDVVIHYRIETMEMMPAVAKPEGLKTRLLYMAGDLDYLRPSVLEQSVEEMVELGEKLMVALKRSKRVRVTTKLGSEIEGILKDPAKNAYYGAGRRARQPGGQDYWPHGLWGFLCEEKSVHGVSILDASLHPTGVLHEPVKVTWRDGRIVDIEGGRQARQWRRWLDSLNSPDVYTHAHFGGGLSKKAQVCGHDWEDVTIYGSFLVSGGNNLIHGGTNRGHCHFDAIMTDATIYLDNELICKDGVYAL